MKEPIYAFDENDDLVEIDESKHTENKEVKQ